MPLIVVYLQLLIMSSSFITAQKPFILMLDPAGDTHLRGRPIDGTDESHIAYACVQELQDALQQKNSNVTVICTRGAQETVDFLQNANGANRLGVDLYVRLQFYQDTSSQQSLTLYRFSWGNECPVRSQKTMFTRYDKAHLHNAGITQSFARRLEQSFTKISPYLCKGVYAIPCRPLLGIISPALCIEASLATQEHWHAYVQPIVNALQELITDETSPQ